jgi:hypothetical protein
MLQFELRQERSIQPGHPEWVHLELTTRYDQGEPLIDF